MMTALSRPPLTEKGFFVTKLSTTGGFLMVGNTTLLIGTEDEYVDEVMKILKNMRHTQACIIADSFVWYW